MKANKEKAIENARRMNGLLHLMLLENDKGNIRISSAASMLGVPYTELRDIYFYLSMSWNPNFFEECDTLEVSIRSEYIFNVQQFLNMGGFEKEVEDGILHKNLI